MKRFLFAFSVVFFSLSLQGQSVVSLKVWDNGGLTDTLKNTTANTYSLNANFKNGYNVTYYVTATSITDSCKCTIYVYNSGDGTNYVKTDSLLFTLPTGTATYKIVDSGVHSQRKKIVISNSKTPASILVKFFAMARSW